MYVPLYTFCKINRYLIYSDWAFEVTLRSHFGFALCRFT